MKRRDLLKRGVATLAGILPGLSLMSCRRPADDVVAPIAGEGSGLASPGSSPVTLFLAGDVIIGRGIDQILAHPSDPRLFEPVVKDAREYVQRAERANGPIPENVAYDYIWGDALAELERIAPAARIINLETSVTTSDEAWPSKTFHYRMHPANVRALTSAGTGVCVLANNHALDWGRKGLRETLETLEGAGVRTAGAGHDLEQATAPAVVPIESGRLLVFAYGARDAGVPGEWAAEAGRSGIARLEDFGPTETRRVIDAVRAHRRPDDRVVISLHWGPNWGYDIPEDHRRFARALIDAQTADVVFGHSSHHPMGIEVYRGRLVLYGCGNMLDDFEGIGFYPEYRPELTLMYFPTLNAAGELAALEVVPMRIRRLRLERASEKDAAWTAARLDHECRKLGGRLERTRSGRLVLGLGLR